MPTARERQLSNHESFPSDLGCPAPDIQHRLLNVKMDGLADRWMGEWVDELTDGVMEENGSYYHQHAYPPGFLYRLPCNLQQPSSEKVLLSPSYR